MVEKLVNEIRELVSYDELEAAIEVLKKSSFIIDQEDDVIIQSARLNDLKNQLRRNIINNEYAEIEKNKIRKAILGLANNLLDSEKPKTNINQKIRQEINQVPVYDPNKCIGREILIKEIHNQLNNTKEPLLLEGIGGIGKTTIALAYIHHPNFKKAYDHIAWVTIKKDLLSELITELSVETLEFTRQPGLDDYSNFLILVSRLNTFKGNNLLVIDNVNEANELLDFKNHMITAQLNWKVLITTRASLGNSKMVRIDKLDDNSALELFESHFNKDIDNENFAQLLNHIDNHTLLIELLAKYGSENPYVNEVGDILDEIKKNGINKISNIPVVAGLFGQEKEIEISNFILELFQTHHLNDEEITYLRYFSILPSAYISIDSLVAFLSVSKEQKIKLANSLNGLSKKGWLAREKFTYKCHQIIQEVIRTRFFPDFNDTKLLISGLNEAIKDDTKTNPATKFMFIPFASSVLNFIDSEHLLIADLYENTSELYKELGDYDTMLAYASESLSIRHKHLLPNDIRIVKSMNLVGRAYTRLGNHKEGYEYRLKAIKHFKNYDNHDLYLMLLNSLSSSCIMVEKEDQAEECLNKALALLEKNDIPNLSKALTFINYSRLKFVQNQFDLCLKYALLSLDIRERELEANHLLIPDTCLEIAKRYILAEDIESAYQYVEKAYKIYNEILHDLHPSKIVCIELRKWIMEVRESYKYKLFKVLNWLFPAFIKR